jgi:anti-anti-sigma regulatory factor
MLRISRGNANNGCVSVRFEGEMTGPWVAETSRVCETIIADGHRLRLDLAQVAFVDRAGVELLASLKKRDALLDHCSPFLAVQLRSARR